MKLNKWVWNINLVSFVKVTKGFHLEVKSSRWLMWRRQPRNICRKDFEKLIQQFLCVAEVYFMSWMKNRNLVHLPGKETFRRQYFPANFNTTFTTSENCIQQIGKHKKDRMYPKSDSNDSAKA